MKRIQALITAVMPITAHLSKLYLKVPQIAQQAQPGQFVTCLVSPRHDPYLRLPLPICGLSGETLSLLLDDRDEGAPALRQEVGETLDLLGPLGHGFRIPPGVSNLLLVSDGTCLAPLLSLADHAVANNRNVTLLMLSVSDGPGLPVSLLPASIEYHTYALTEGWTWEQTGWQGLIAWADQTYVALADRLRASLAQQQRQDPIRWRRDMIQAWVWRPMACGLGICQACAIPTRKGIQHVCSDGPVFDLYDLY